MSDNSDTKPEGQCAIGPDMGNGQHPVIVVHEGGSVHSGMARAYKEGEPMLPGDSIVEVVPHEHGCGIGSYRTLYAQEPHSGPAQVATEAYRRGWEAIFGKKGAN